MLSSPYPPPCQPSHRDGLPVRAMGQAPFRPPRLVCLALAFDRGCRRRARVDGKDRAGSTIGRGCIP